MKMIDSLLVEFEAQLADYGARGAMAWLNSRTQYRYTALYLVDAGVLNNVYLFDRDDPTDKPYVNTPVHEPYCNLVMDAGQAVVINDALHDARTMTHPYNSAIRSFCGFPLRGVDGSVRGALCYFDGQPRQIDNAEVSLLEAAGQLLNTALNQISKL